MHGFGARHNERPLKKSRKLWPQLRFWHCLTRLVRQLSQLTLHITDLVQYWYRSSLKKSWNQLHTSHDRWHPHNKDMHKLRKKHLRLHGPVNALKGTQILYRNITTSRPSFQYKEFEWTASQSAESPNEDDEISILNSSCPREEPHSCWYVVQSSSQWSNRLRSNSPRGCQCFCESDIAKPASHCMNTGWRISDSSSSRMMYAVCLFVIVS